MSSDFYLLAGDAYRGIMQEVIEFGELVPPLKNKTSPSVGQQTHEIRGHCFHLDHVRSRYIWAAGRPLNAAFCLGNYLFFMSGSVSTERLAYYNPVASRFSDDTVTIPGSCYGARVWRQLATAFSLLREDPTTRRAVVTIFDGNIDHHDSVDIPCPVSMQFFIRKRELDMVITFRSQNIVMVFPYDLFLFTMIQETMAMTLGLEPGTYTQFTGSMHCYSNEIPIAREILDQAIQTVPMAAMDPLSSEQLYRLLMIELMYQDYAAGKRQLDSIAVELVSLPPYWQKLCYVMERFAEVRRNGERFLRERDAFV